MAAWTGSRSLWQGLTRHQTALVVSVRLPKRTYFFFDIVELEFVHKMLELANKYRYQLRSAKNRVSMLVIASHVVTNVEKIAGPDRADGLCERLAIMLSPE